ncbi:hypothetical protein ASPWEDRAFT_41147 [Aspergillus wentii DTO 134E9]|uniref:Uncharacterized protein n=1 Tax=Aspergillus wentii DTO 134E9 TaxID=1073089 RepID=A0A1L9RLU1_ASPWE|nr:uncharacterized protein ASPWEDRAFT_41147 [Aspergillus wentii DTO 134E9]OJJ35915.1 hypothetical protein ASPWEDRAFT_41147 [Aspergillus wentii DTO 134E9]
MPQPSAKDPFQESSSLEYQEPPRKQNFFRHLYTTPYSQLTVWEILLRFLIALLFGAAIGAVIGVIIRFA